MGAPAKLPAKFFDSQPPDKLPANFFDQQQAQQALEAQKNYSAQQFAGDLVKGFSNAQLQTIAGAGSLANKVIKSPWLANEVARLQQAGVQQNPAQNIGGFAENVGEMLAGGEGLKALGLAGEGAGLLNNVGSQAALGAASSGAHGGSPVTGALVGAGAELGAQGLQRLAPAMADSALGITGKMRQYGKQPAQAFLNDTSGVNMDKIAASANGQINTLANQVRSLASRYTGETDLQPILDKIDSEMATAKSHNLKNQYNDLQDLKQFLTVQQVGDNAGTALPTKLSPLELLQKRQALREYIEDIGKFEQGKNQGALGAAKQAYHQINEYFHQAVPGAAPLDQKIASLLPVAKRASVVDLNAGTAQRVMNRVARPTGALITGDLGYAMGGPAGAAVGLVAPEIASSPAVKAALARTLNVAPDITRPIAIPLWNSMQGYIPNTPIRLSDLGQR
ncbi:MAG: hypothetical protein KGL39_14210 [Patescibacteria group bacterium]|nr:hypothetical protein [Patescibacteria group bacterium]